MSYTNEEILKIVKQSTDRASSKFNKELAEYIVRDKMHLLDQLSYELVGNPDLDFVIIVYNEGEYSDTVWLEGVIEEIKKLDL